MEAIPGIEVLVHRVHAPSPVFRRSSLRKHCQRVAFQEDLAFLILGRANLEAFAGETTQIPLAIPKVIFTSLADSLSQGRVFFDILPATQEFGSLNEVDQRPMVEERDHGAFSTTEVQAVVPVGAQPLTDAIRANLLSGEIQRAFEVLVNGGFSTIGKGNDFIKKGDFPGLLDILTD